jgi:hypothetical protein
MRHKHAVSQEGSRHVSDPDEAWHPRIRKGSKFCATVIPDKLMLYIAYRWDIVDGFRVKQPNWSLSLFLFLVLLGMMKAGAYVAGRASV